MTTRTITPTERLTVVKHLAAGKAHHVVATIARLNVKVITELGEEYGYPDREQLGKAAAQLEQEIEDAAAPPVRPERTVAQIPPPGGGWARKTLPHAGDPPTRRPLSSPTAGASTPPAARPDLKATTKAGTFSEPFPLVDDEQTARLRALINTAKGIPTRKVQRQLERALDALTSLQELITEHQKVEAARTRAEKEKAAARAEVDRLEQQLREARAKLKSSTQRPGGVAATKSGQLAAVRGGGLVTTADLEALGVTSKQVRTWAHEHDVECPDSGRLPSRVLDAWKAAHTEGSKAS